MLSVKDRGMCIVSAQLFLRIMKQYPGELPLCGNMLD